MLNAIHSRQTGFGPGVRVGVGIKTPTPESESTPMKTLLTPQPWFEVMEPSKPSWYVLVDTFVFFLLSDILHR